MITPNVPVSSSILEVAKATGTVPREEFLGRQKQAKLRASERDLDGLLAWGRGAGSQDSFVEPYYLANFYTHFPHVPDRPGHWAARGHTAFLLPCNGASTLVVDLPAFREDLVVADDVVAVDDVVAGVINVLRSWPPGSRVGVLGMDALSARWHGRLASDSGCMLFDVDDLGVELRLIKSAVELDLLRRAGALGARVVDTLMEAGAVPGVTEAEVAAEGIAALVRGGGQLYGLSISSGPYAHMYAQSQPAPYEPRRRLVAGDMLRVDAYGSLDGYLFDFGRSRIIERSRSAEQQQMLDAVRDAVHAGAAAVKPGATIADVALACDESFDASKWAASGRGVRTAFASWGHGLGINWEGPWIDKSNDMVIEPGMCLAVEKRVGDPEIGGANFEDNYIVTEQGAELITPALDRHPTD